jgi:hypothetical protein
MSIIKLDTKDVMPVVIIVLNYISCDIDTSIVKLAFNNQYAHLKGSIDPEEFSQEISDMAARLDDPLSVILRAFSEELMSLYYTLAATHDLVLEEIFEDYRLCQLASDVYSARAVYTYEVTNFSKWDVEVYFLSLPIVIDQLRELVNTEEFDVDELKDSRNLCPDYFENFLYAGGTIEKLGDIALRIFVYHDQVNTMLNEP